MSQLSARSLAKQFGDRLVVKNISLEVNSGEIVGLLGPNGAGKTTSFYMIVGLIPVDHGSIFLNQRELTHEPIHTRAQLGIGYLPQEASVFRKLSVEDNLYAIIETRKNLSIIAKKQLLEKLLEEFHIGHIRKSLGMALSGGERRRVEIARALAMDPQFILLDEPFAGVDPISVLDIQGIIKALAARGIGILITDHNVRETLSVCERAYIFNEGEVIAKGSPDEILQDKHVLSVYLGRDFRL
ncbi:MULTISPECIES: LPS export ABC transporter ATP-binding protein [unclassified Methylophaga]|jgi:lipopolysaccharide export system ATP-binding protein|uniref:LPS export ABC transporter ATP-binding protein n=1 Tax=unclassified Methylophaga TaxID=2629249 RepID=UPI000C3E9FA7|nr:MULTISPECIES: LPS export ABC transporter ATP-binding protein [unclassified Methylophaga]MAL50869.1 LPS export ABC transporter ATP-binding protein [Methylophaga sp.]MAP26789.1 LPS export ABC transporter ATP-binding protein [Methylophaga sp.]MBP25827.1 LPS export ABC transporter ATP-binding protein [Methylophaga sp.]HAD30176.1 LPS export ABC transporter ATP-binding protein [Methylophaga sp.]HCO01132.1 LPS export ABC transporter ATP-binding protein [Methylophaga sp.]|tara:strand:- start:36 stop:761 length:726 start_codon:yes stop_codon:yes gene_type:complete